MRGWAARLAVVALGACVPDRGAGWPVEDDAAELSAAADVTRDGSNDSAADTETFTGTADLGDPGADDALSEFEVFDDVTSAADTVKVDSADAGGTDADTAKADAKDGDADTAPVSCPLDTTCTAPIGTHIGAGFDPLPPPLIGPTPGLDLPPPAAALPAGATVECGGQKFPYFWATGGIPAPIACTDTCAPTAHADVTTCGGGQCLVQRCALGWQDRNGFGNDGCEVEVPVTCELYVDGKQNPPGQDGSQAHPFFTIRQALGVVKADCVIHIAAGDYAGGLVIDKPGVVLRGEGPGKTRILADTEATRGPLPMGGPYATEKAAPKPVAAIRIQAADAVLEGLTIWGGSPAVQGQSADRALIRSSVLGGVDMYFGRWDAIATPTGVSFQSSEDTRIVLARLTHVGHTIYNYHGQDGPWSAWLDYFGWPLMNTGSTGVFLDGINFRMMGGRVDDLVASPNCEAQTGQSYSCTFAPGGSITGISANSGMVSGVTIENAKPGAGNDPNIYDFQPPAPPGELVTFSGLLTDWTDLDPSGHFVDLAGCVGGKVSGLLVPLRISNSSAMAIDSVQLPNTLARHALILGGCSSCTLSNSKVGDTMIADAPNLAVNAVSIGKIAISDSAGVKLNAITATGQLSIANSPGAVVSHSKLHKIAATGCAGCKFEDLECAHVDATFTVSGKTEIPQDLTVVSIEGNDMTIEDMRIHDIGGPYSTSIANSDLMGGLSASTVGLELSGDGINVKQLAIWDITWMPAWGITGGSIYKCNGVVANGKNTSIDHATIVLDLTGTKYGPPTIQPVGQFSGSIANSIVMIYGSITDDLGYPLTGSCLPSGLAPTSSLFWNCTASTSAGFTKADPMLDFSGAFPVPTCTAGACSPAIDGGSGDFCSEPAPNGCKANIGYGGGTSLAVSKPGASTCGCP